jgi:hypothetical protein
MSYDEVEIEDMEFYDDEDGGFYTYPCPCGDYFQITRVPATPTAPPTNPNPATPWSRRPVSPWPPRRSPATSYHRRLYPTLLAFISNQT